MTTFFTIEQIKRYNADKGYHWFSSGAMRFFNSRILSGVYRGKYFITSERFNMQTPRYYTIRMIDETGRIHTIGEFQQYKSADSARRAAKKLS